MQIKKIHYISGVIITVFVGLHLFNHAISIFGADRHIEMMHSLRTVYRNLFAETILILSISVQIFSGIKLFISNRKKAVSPFGKLHIRTGLYLAIFFIIHLSAVLGGRFFLNLDTNFYFGAAGLNTFPFYLFFIPYYGLAILSFFGHIAAIHSKKMKQDVFGLSPEKQSIAIIALGIIFTVIIFYGFTNRFSGVTIPEEYGVMIGK